MVKYVTVMKSGNSAVIALPAEWRKSRAIDIGNKLSVSYSANGALVIEKASEMNRQKLKAFADSMSRIDSINDETAWDDESKDADRALAAERYMD